MTAPLTRPLSGFLPPPCQQGVYDISNQKYVTTMHQGGGVVAVDDSSGSSGAPAFVWFRTTFTAVDRDLATANGVTVTAVYETGKVIVWMHVYEQ